MPSPLPSLFSIFLSAALITLTGAKGAQHGDEHHAQGACNRFYYEGRTKFLLGLLGEHVPAAQRGKADHSGSARADKAGLCVEPAAQTGAPGT